MFFSIGGLFVDGRNVNFGVKDQSIFAHIQIALEAGRQTGDFLVQHQAVKHFKIFVIFKPGESTGNPKLTDDSAQ